MYFRVNDIHVQHPAGCFRVPTTMLSQSTAKIRRHAFVKLAAFVFKNVYSKHTCSRAPRPYRIGTFGRVPDELMAQVFIQELHNSSRIGTRCERDTLRFTLQLQPRKSPSFRQIGRRQIRCLYRQQSTRGRVGHLPESTYRRVTGSLAANLCRYSHPEGV